MLLISDEEMWKEELKVDDEEEDEGEVEFKLSEEEVVEDDEVFFSDKLVDKGDDVEVEEGDEEEKVVEEKFEILKLEIEIDGIEWCVF